MKKVAVFIKIFQAIVVVYGLISLVAWMMFIALFWVFGTFILKSPDSIFSLLRVIHSDYPVLFYIDGFSILYAIFYTAYYE